MTNWDDLRFFLAVAREASLRKAARALGVSRSTVLRRVTAIERRLEVRLFERLPTGYFTTPAGVELLRSALRMEREAAAADDRVAGRDTRLAGTIRVTLPGLLATHLSMPDLAAFDRAHPGVRLELILTYAIVDVANREADVAIRISNRPPKDLIARHILDVAKAAYVCEDFLPGAETKARPPRLCWIGAMDDPTALRWVDDGDFADMPMGARVNDPLAKLEAAKAGVGMALLPCFAADAEPGLYRMPSGAPQLHKGLWILTHEARRDTRSIDTFVDFMADSLRGHRDRIEGNRPRMAM